MESLVGMRIVLSWGATPYDLDSRLIYRSKNGAEQHIDYSIKDGIGAHLDVDDTDSFGPETITITKIQPNQSYIYAVSDYSNHDIPRSRALSRSGAKVFVYTGRSLVKTYSVPLDREGNIWTVFRIEQNGQITDLNAINGVAYLGKLSGGTISRDSYDARRNKIPSIRREFADNAALSRTISASINPAAIEQNSLGEKAYHNGDIELSIDYYKNAVEIDPNFAQAYSNMGLSYLKLNRFSESIWANRNAISLASGEGANIVRASSYYNIARLYEQDKEYSEALRYYELAKSANNNPTYDKAIARVKAKR
jgi:tetratricopeptide (TPR) repeat protein